MSVRRRTRTTQTPETWYNTGAAGSAVARLATAQDNHFGNDERFCFLCGGFGYALPEGGGSAKTAETTTQNTKAFLFYKERHE